MFLGWFVGCCAHGTMRSAVPVLTYSGTLSPGLLVECALGFLRHATCLSSELEAVSMLTAHFFPYDFLARPLSLLLAEEAYIASVATTGISYDGLVAPVA